jgi:B12-binding domain/radical SAM domain protein
MLRVMAVTAPHWVSRGNSSATRSLNSSEPFSLHNAIRLAAYKAENKVGNWAFSNWSTFEERNRSILMYEYFETQKKEYIELLQRIKPNLLLIGSMSLGFAGAVEIADIAKKYLENEVFIVLGGKHVIETTYLINGQIADNAGCALGLMKNKKIPQIFDLVASGDGEELIVEIGELIGELTNKGIKLHKLYEHIDLLLKAKGEWLAGWIDNNNEYSFIKSLNNDIDYNSLPYPIELFEIKSNFPVLQSQVTAHTYSYLSKGCPFNCFFCSEKSGINGKLRLSDTAPDRLLQQFKLLRKYGEAHNLKKISAFVEDSILLGGQISLLNKFNKLLSEENPEITFGGQLTVDLLLNKDLQRAIIDMSRNGLRYVFVGIETGNNNIALKMSKNTNKNQYWADKNENVIKFLNENNIDCGVSVLFGLGESQSERIELFRTIERWRKLYKRPQIVSLNYATQHPLKNQNITYDYIEWGTPFNSPYLNIFTELFGEASVNYALPNVKLGSVEEFEEIKDYFTKLNLTYQ